MRFTALILLISTASPAFATDRQDIEAARQDRREIYRDQQICEYWLARYVQYSQWNRNNVVRYSWDRAGGFIDPSDLNDLRYTLQNISDRLVRDIGRIEQSNSPDPLPCREASLQAQREHYAVTKDLLLYSAEPRD